MAMRRMDLQKFGSIRYNTWIMTTIEKKNQKVMLYLLESQRRRKSTLSIFTFGYLSKTFLTFTKKFRKLHPEAEILLDISDWTSKKKLSFSKNLGVQCINPRNIGLDGILNFPI